MFSTYYRWKDLPLLVTVAIVYFLIAHINTDFFRSINMPISAIHPQVGFALGILLLGGKRYILAIFIGSIAARLSLDYTVFNSLLLTCAISIGVLFSHWLLTKDKFDCAITSLSDFFRLLFLGGMIGVSISSLIAIWMLLDTPVFDEPVFQNIIRWWMADTLGIILITPLVLACRQFPYHWLQKYTFFEVLLFFSMAFLIGQSIFIGWFPDTFGLVARGYWMFLFVVWGAARLGMQSVGLVLCMTMIQALWGAKIGKGFFGTDIIQTHLANFWFYMFTLTIVGMGLSATINGFKKAETAIRKLAHHDVLTGLANRLLLTDHINQAVLLAKRSKNCHFALIFHDLDEFKPVNDNYGHKIGDVLLTEVARRIERCVREVDTVARLGGDEFVIFLPNIEKPQDAVAIAERIHNELLQPFEIQNHVINISTSIGVAIYPEHGLDEETLLINADNAMYFAKQAGRNNIKIYDSEMPKISQRN